VLRAERLKVANLPPLDFEVGDGECMGLEGPSGSGKTRVARALADLEPVEGHIFVNGAERTEVPAPAWRRLVRYVSSEPGWWTETARESFPRDPAAISALSRLMTNLNLAPELLDKPISVLSTGERQRLALVRSLIDTPPVLVLDEPTSALDRKNTALVEEILRYQLLNGGCIILISHDRAQIDRLADLRLQLAPVEYGRP
jgi:UDP-glucose/iron transport system ATP-binding protein